MITFVKSGSMSTFARHTKNLFLTENFFQSVKLTQALLSHAQKFSVSSSTHMGFKTFPTKKFVACAWTGVNNEIHVSNKDSTISLTTFS